MIHRDIDTQVGYSVASPQAENYALSLPREKYRATQESLN
jgi:hypothetical protein